MPLPTPSFVPYSKDIDGVRAMGVDFADIDSELKYKTSIAVRGWVIPAGDGIPTSVVVTSRKMLVATATFDLARADVLAHFRIEDCPYRPGFHLRLSTLCLPTRFSLEILVDVAFPGGNTRRIPLGEIHGDGRRFSDLNESRYAPILVPAVGRSGTTLLMRLLNSHPEILAPGKYPYEYRQASFLWHALRILASPANHSASMHPDGFETAHRFHVGFNPYLHREYHKIYGLTAVSDWQDDGFVLSLIDFMKRSVDEYVDRASLDAGRHGIRFLAEKTVVSPMNQVVMNVYENAKQIFIVRDIRDTYISAKAFNAKRGYRSFGFEKLSDEKVLRARVGDAQQLVLSRLACDERTLFVRYEDLIADTQGVTKALLAFIGVEKTEEIVSTMIDRVQDTGERSTHATTLSPTDSIGRWRSEMTNSEKEFCAREFKSFFETFGYPVS